MNILALDTSMGVCSASVLRKEGRARYLCEAEMQRGHAEALMPMIEDVLGQAELRARDLDLIAATLGPGSFTGVRIAIAAARGLALVSEAKLYGTDSLTVMARTALSADAAPSETFAVAVDARRSMLYLGLYDAAGHRLDGPTLIAPEDAARHLPEALSLAVGSGAGALAAAAATQGRNLVTALPALQPGAAALADISLESRDYADALRPLYLRPPDAKPQVPPLERR